MKEQFLYPFAKPLINLDLQFFASRGTYDAKLVTVLVNNVNITGFAEGTFVSSKKLSDSVKEHVSAQGDVAFAVVNNSLGEIRIVLNQTSPSIPYLNRLAASGARVPVWVISNNEVKEKSGGTYGIVKTPPEQSFSGEITTREYVFLVADHTVS